MCHFHSLIFHFKHLLIVFHWFFIYKICAKYHKDHGSKTCSKWNSNEIIHHNNSNDNLERNSDKSCQLISHIGHSLCINLTVIHYFWFCECLFRNGSISQRFIIDEHRQAIRHIYAHLRKSIPSVCLAQIFHESCYQSDEEEQLSLRNILVWLLLIDVFHDHWCQKWAKHRQAHINP